MSTIQMQPENIFTYPHPVNVTNTKSKKGVKSKRINWSLFFTYLRNIILLFPTFLGLVLSIIFKQVVLLGIGILGSMALLPSDLQADDEEDK